jgi:tripartite-type tricarboxylate transporter receptor subunit TctC
MFSRKTALRGLSAAMACAVFSIAAAQQYPNRPIRMLLPLPPGASVDALGRLLASKMSEQLGQPIVVDNRPGGNMVIASEAVARAAPDGYTIYFTLDQPIVANQHLLAKLPYDPDKDFVPIGLIAEAYMVLLASTKVPARNIKELVQYAKANPGKLSFGHGALPAHVTGEMLRKIGIDLVFVPFRGGAPTLQAALGGVVDLAVTDITPAIPYIGSGKLSALAAISQERLPLAQAVPTMKEQGYPDFVITNWIGLMAPAGTPAPVLRRLNEVAMRAMNTAEVKEKVSGFGLSPMASTIEEMAARIKSDVVKWEKLVKDSGVRLE